MKTLGKAAEDVYNVLNVLTYLRDEGYLNEELEIKQGVSLDDINEFLYDNKLCETFDSRMEFQNVVQGMRVLLKPWMEDDQE